MQAIPLQGKSKNRHQVAAGHQLHWANTDPLAAHSGNIFIDLENAVIFGGVFLKHAANRPYRQLLVLYLNAYRVP